MTRAIGLSFLMLIFFSVFPFGYTSTLAFDVVSVLPEQNSTSYPEDECLYIELSNDADVASLNNNSIVVNSDMTGLHLCSFSYDYASRTVTLCPHDPFMVGELVTVVVTTGVESSSGQPLSQSFTWSFTIRSYPAAAEFTLSSSFVMDYYRPEFITPGDLDSDGEVELLVKAFKAHRDCGVMHLENDGTGTLSEYAFYLPPDGDFFNIGNTELDDLDRDGDLDMMVSEGGDHVFHNDGEGNMNHYDSYGHQQHPCYGTYLLTSFFNGDGLPDLIGTRDVFSPGICMNRAFGNGSGGFGLWSNAYFDACCFPLHKKAGDFDNDGNIDFVACTIHSDDDGRSVWAAFNDGTGAFNNFLYVTTLGHYLQMDVADFNSDGYLDVAVINANCDLEISLNTGDMAFEPPVCVVDSMGLLGLKAADFDGDESTDIALIGVDEVVILLNDGNGGFIQGSSCSITPDVGQPIYVCTADMNGDMRQDLVITRFNAGIDVLLNSFNCVDSDEDGYGDPDVPDNHCWIDNCPNIPNPSQADADEDDIGDVCDECTDTDGDGYGDPGYPATTCQIDNCPNVSNPDQADSDGNGTGDLCESGNAMQFDGADEIVIPHSASLSFSAGSQMTIELWFMKTTSANHYHILGKRGDGCSHALNNYQIAENPENGLHFISGDHLAGCGLHPEPNTWYHVASVYDGSTLRIYVNGSLAESRSYTLVGENSTSVKIGASDNCGLSLEGLIDEVRIWNRARSQGEIAADMYRSLCGSEEGLVGLWTFEETEDNQTVDDLSPSGNNGTLGIDASVAGDDPVRIESTAPIERRDFDCDGYTNDLDNCPFEYNPDQIDSDGDGVGDACDDDAPVYKWCWGRLFYRWACISPVREVEVEMWATLDNEPIDLLIDFYDFWPCFAIPCFYWTPIPTWANDLLVRVYNVGTNFTVYEIKVLYMEYQYDKWSLRNIVSALGSRRSADFEFPTILDTLGNQDSIYVLINLAEWTADPRPLLEEYEFTDGVCPDLPGYLVGTAPFSFDPNTGPDENPYTTVLYSGSMILAGESDLAPDYVCGDADQSGGVDIDDIVYLIAYVFQGGPEPIPVESGDSNCSGSTDIDDIVYLINYVFQGGFSPCDPDGDGVPDC